MQAMMATVAMEAPTPTPMAALLLWGVCAVAAALSVDVEGALVPESVDAEETEDALVPESVDAEETEGALVPKSVDAEETEVARVVLPEF